MTFHLLENRLSSSKGLPKQFKYKQVNKTHMQYKEGYLYFKPYLRKGEERDLESQMNVFFIFLVKLWNVWGIIYIWGAPVDPNIINEEHAVGNVGHRFRCDFFTITLLSYIFWAEWHWAFGWSNTCLALWYLNNLRSTQPTHMICYPTINCTIR